MKIMFLIICKSSYKEANGEGQKGHWYWVGIRSINKNLFVSESIRTQ